MRETDLLEAIGDIDNKFIKNAGKAKTRDLRWVPIAVALLSVTVLGLIFIPKLFEKDSPDLKPTEIKQTLSDSTVETGVTAMETETSGVYVPAVEIPESTEEGTTLDMIGFVVYKGNIYTQSMDYTGEEAYKIDEIVGEYLGTAKGNIDEWSSQDEYAVEFASSVAGEIYAVEGYDTSFRICLRAEYEDENGPGLWIQFLDCLNGITLSKGSDLFEDRLRVRELTGSVQWQSHEDWDYNTGNFKDADIDEAVWNEFWDAVDNGDFFDAWDHENLCPVISDMSHQAHMIINMNDGTKVNIRMIEFEGEGYVGYQGFNWYYVKVPKEIFDKVYEACGGTYS